MLISQDDKTLALKIAEGDSEAENYLFHRFKERIQFLVRMRLKSKIPPDDQKDIVSEVQQAILLSLRKGSYDHSRGKSLEAYIAGIAINIVSQYFRKLKKDKTTGNIEQIQQISNQGNILLDIINEERNEKVRIYLKKLKPKYKEVLVLRFYQNKSIEEIANLLNLEKRRVSERINYAFKLLLKECRKDNYFSI
jgi:RNA polymerase sigma-70 factor (ECF subfamily)